MGRIKTGDFPGKYGGFIPDKGTTFLSCTTREKFGRIFARLPSNYCGRERANILVILFSYTSLRGETSLIIVKFMANLLFIFGSVIVNVFSRVLSGSCARVKREEKLSKSLNFSRRKKKYNDRLL